MSRTYYPSMNMDLWALISPVGHRQRPRPLLLRPDGNSNHHDLTASAICGRLSRPGGPFHERNVMFPSSKAFSRGRIQVFTTQPCLSTLRLTPFPPEKSPLSPAAMTRPTVHHPEPAPGTTQLRCRGEASCVYQAFWLMPLPSWTFGLSEGTSWAFRLVSGVFVNPSRMTPACGATTALPMAFRPPLKSCAREALLLVEGHEENGPRNRWPRGD